MTTFGNYFSLHNHSNTSSDDTSCFAACRHLCTADALWSLLYSAQCSYVRIMTETPLGAGVVLKTVFTAFSCAPPPSHHLKASNVALKRDGPENWASYSSFFYTHKNTQVFLSRQKSDRRASDMPEGYSTFKEWTFRYYKAVRASVLHLV